MTEIEQETLVETETTTELVDNNSDTNQNDIETTMEENQTIVEEETIEENNETIEENNETPAMTENTMEENEESAMTENTIEENEEPAMTENTIEENKAEAPTAETTNEGNEKTEDTAAVAKPQKKLFVGGIQKQVNLEKFKAYFSKFGEMEQCFLVMDRYNKQNHRGFGFVTFKDGAVGAKVMAGTHRIEGTTKDVNIGEASVENKKFFIGGLGKNTDGMTDEVIKKHFSKYGEVTEVNLKHDRGFCFLSMNENESGNLYTVLQNESHNILGRDVNISLAKKQQENNPGRGRGGFNSMGGRGRGGSMNMNMNYGGMQMGWNPYAGMMGNYGGMMGNYGGNYGYNQGGRGGGRQVSAKKNGKWGPY